MNTRKRILSICLVFVVALGITGCVDSEKQDRLLQFMNEDLAEERKLELEANNLYTQVLEDDSQHDDELYEALVNTIIPNYEKIVAGASDIDLGEFTEFSKLKSLIIQYWSKKKEAFSVLATAAEQHDESITQEANTIFEEADTIYDKYDKELNQLGKEYDVTFDD